MWFSRHLTHQELPTILHCVRRPLHSSANAFVAQIPFHFRWNSFETFCRYATTPSLLVAVLHKHRFLSTCKLNGLRWRWLILIDLFRRTCCCYRPSAHFCRWNHPTMSAKVALLIKVEGEILLRSQREKTNWRIRLSFIGTENIKIYRTVTSVTLNRARNMKKKRNVDGWNVISWCLNST